MSPDDLHVRGYADGFFRRPIRSTDPIYLAAYRLGASRAPARPDGDPSP